MPSITHFEPATTLHVRVLGPESATPSPADLRRLFAGRMLSRTRRERIASATRLVVQHGARVIGLAAYDRADDELRVYELALDPSLCFGAQDILHQLLEGLEMACLAGGCRRVVLLPAAVVATTALERLGYEVVVEGCAGGWLAKHFV